MQPLPSTVHSPELTDQTGLIGGAGGGEGGAGGPGAGGPGAGGPGAGAGGPPFDPGMDGMPSVGMGGGIDQCVTKQSAILKPPLSPHLVPQEF
jgi:hypothetical protein